MSTTPVQLDFSKAQPVSQAAGSGVSLDFSKAQPVATGDALNAAASTVAKPAPDVINDDSYNLAGTAYSVVAPPDPQKAHPDFHANFVKDANGKWQLQMQYPAGQRAVDPNFPEESTDDEHNIYHRGNKQEVMTYSPVPVPGIGSGVEVLADAAKAGGKAFLQGAKSQIVKQVGKYVGIGGASAASGGALWELGSHFAKSWLKKITD